MSALDCCPEVRQEDSHGKMCGYFCYRCGRRKGVGCSCDLSFSDRMKLINLDRAALRRFHEGS